MEVFSLSFLLVVRKLARSTVRSGTQASRPGRLGECGEMVPSLPSPCNGR